MAEEKLAEKITEQDVDKKSLSEWVKEHRNQILLAGLSVTTISATILGLKNKDAIIGLWNTLKKQIEKGSLYSSRWFEKASIEELETAREIVQQDYNNPDLDIDYRSSCWNLLKKFDDVIGRKKWNGKEYGYPVHSSNGWYLPSDD